jgi:hypothetical protein
LRHRVEQAVAQARALHHASLVLTQAVVAFITMIIASSDVSCSHSACPSRYLRGLHFMFESA